MEQSPRGDDDDVELEEEPELMPQWGATHKTERLLRARQAKAEAEKASTAAKGLAAEEGVRVFIEYDASGVTVRISCHAGGHGAASAALRPQHTQHSTLPW